MEFTAFQLVAMFFGSEEVIPTSTYMYLLILLFSLSFKRSMILDLWSNILVIECREQKIRGCKHVTGRCKLISKSNVLRKHVLFTLTYIHARSVNRVRIYLSVMNDIQFITTIESSKQDYTFELDPKFLALLKLFLTQEFSL